MRKLLLTALLSITAALAGLAPETAEAASPLECAPNYEVDALRLLRQTSLDLLGRPPTYEELDATRNAPDRHAAVEQAIAQMLASEEYLATVRAQHRALVWGNLSVGITRLISQSKRLATVPNVGSTIWTNSQTSTRQRYRGRADLRCIDQQQTEFDQNGRPVPINVFSDPSCSGGNTCKQEGWVWVEPYWAPGEQVKVCAYDAQAFEVSPLNPSKLCSDQNDAGCGCGPNLRWCSTPATQASIRESLANEAGRIFEWVIGERQSYLEAFRTDTTMMNGPVAHFYRHMNMEAKAESGRVAFEADMGEVPDIPFTTEAWTPVTRGEAHAGAFTTAGFLMRFASLRGRANRFYTAFYCDPFVPSADGLPAEEEAPSPNLRERDGCAGCHEVLEPAAAHFARWRTASAHGYLGPDLLELEAETADCLCGEGTGKECSGFCNKYFVTADNSDLETYAEFGGQPLSSAYASPLELQNAEDGPAALVDEPAEQYAVAQCAVRTMAERLLHRQLEATELDWLDTHTERFVSSGYDYTEMVANLVSDERYRQTR